MRKFISFIWLISISLVGISQSMLPLVQDTNVNQFGHEMSISGFGDYQSTSIGKDITRAFFYGGLIDESENDLEVLAMMKLTDLAYKFRNRIPESQHQFVQG